MSRLVADEDPAYLEALRAIEARGRFGIRLGLARTRALLHATGDPQAGLRGPLIGGTNGKGSVQAMVAAVLREAGLRVGQTPKPHLVSYRERIVIDGSPIAPHDFAAIVGEVLAHTDRVARRHGDPTEFEVLTVAAFSWFRRAAVDAAVVEVGLGGRLDATNAWDGGVAAITNVDLDHVAQLGGTLTAIGREKAAIIKRGDLAVTGATGEGLVPIRRRAARLDVALREVTPLATRAMDRHGLVLEHPSLGELRLALLGRHQAANASVAIATLEALAEAGLWSWDSVSVRRGLAAARWPGRLELLAGPPEVLLDGAHNEAGMQALAAALTDLRPELSAGRVTVLLGIAADKEVHAMLRELAGAASLRSARIIPTTMSSVRAMPATELAAAWRDAAASVGSGAAGSLVDQTIEPIGDWSEALDRGLQQALIDGGLLLVAGSLYLVGDVRGRLVPA
ncbi:MAG: bifunctional folylpolyglutamate synthase/dihydrofolate synthase [Chloroflexi bacterium]|nr:bifunctional folylpolyglutamate synthase/dihydrofolate synthase [Chloroflexota bacterium]